MLQGTGLGKAHSGGALLDLAIASCKRLDVFGAGMFSLGPGEDVVYQHFYDMPLTPHCRAPCLFAMPAAERNRTASTLAGGPMPWTSTGVSKGVVMRLRGTASTGSR